MPIARVNFRPRNLTTRVPPSTGIQVALAIAAKKGPTEPTLVTSQSDFLRRYTVDGIIPVDADDGHWSAWTYLAKGDKLWLNRVLGRTGTAVDVDYAGVKLGASSIEGTATALTGSPTLVQGDGTDADALTSLGHETVSDITDPESDAMGSGFFDDETDSATDHTPKQVVLVHAANPGAWGNRISIEILAADGRVADTDDGEVRELVVYFDGVEVGNRVLVSRTKGLKDARGRALYIEDALTGHEYVRAVDSTESEDLHIGLTDDISTTTDAAIATGNVKGSATGKEAFTMGGGDDGTAVTASEYEIGYAPFKNLNIYPDIKLLLDGGMASASVATELGSIARSRVSAQAILNLPQRAFDEDDWATDTTGSDDKNAAAYLDSGVPKTKYVNYYAPWVSYADEFNRREILVPMDGIVAGNVSLAAAAGRQYDAVAGPELGLIDEALDVAYRLADADLDILYDTLRVNPIRYERGYDINIWGNRTAEAIPTDESEFHVRLMMMDIGPRLVRALRRHIYRANTPAERRAVYTLVDTFMQRVQRDFGVYDFEVVCDSTNNTIAEEEQNRMVVWLFIWVTRVSEQIDFYPILTPRSVTLADARQSLALAA